MKNNLGESNQYFNIEEFINKLGYKQYTANEILEMVSEEINRAEQLKISLVEQIKQQPDAVVNLSNELDTYVYQLQEILTHLPADSAEKRVLSSDEIQVLRDRIGEILNKKL